MSDRPLGDDWWLASDGKWYPPQSRQDLPPPPPPSPPYAGIATDPTAPQPVPPAPYPGASPPVPVTPGRRTLSSGLTGTLMGFQIAAGALFALGGMFYIATWAFWQDFESSGSTEFSTVADMADAGDAFSALGFFMALVVFVLIIIWLNLAYKAARSRGATHTKWSSGWAVGGWFIPFANFVIPKLVINEVDRMSRLELTEPIGSSWIGLKRTTVADWWWILQVGGLFLANIMDSVILESDNGLDLLVWSGLLYIIGGAGMIIGGVTVRIIGGRLRP